MALSSTILITIYCKQIFNQIKILNFDVKMYYYSHVSTIIFFIYVNQIKWCKWCMRARCRRVCETILTYKYLYWKLLHRNNKKTKNGYWDNLKKKLYSKCCIFYTQTHTHTQPKKYQIECSVSMSYPSMWKLETISCRLSTT